MQFIEHLFIQFSSVLLKIVAIRVQNYKKRSVWQKNLNKKTRKAECRTLQSYILTLAEMLYGINYNIYIIIKSISDLRSPAQRPPDEVGKHEM